MANAWPGLPFASYPSRTVLYSEVGLPGAKLGAPVPPLLSSVILMLEEACERCFVMTDVIISSLLLLLMLPWSWPRLVI